MLWVVYGWVGGWVGGGIGLSTRTEVVGVGNIEEGGWEEGRGGGGGFLLEGIEDGGEYLVHALSEWVGGWVG